MEDTNINNEEPIEEEQDDSTQVEEPTETDTEGETEETPVEEEDEFKDVPFHKNPRFQELIQKNKESSAKLDELTSQIESLKTVLKPDATVEQKDEAWDQIKKMDLEGFTTYEELAQAIVDVTAKQVKKQQEVEVQTLQEAKQANINMMVTDLKDLTDTGLLEKEEQEEFINWCADKLEETTDTDHPQGNVAVYGDLKRAVAYYRHYKSTPVTKETDEKKRLDRSKIGPSGSADNKTKKYTADEIKNIDWRDVSFGDLK